MSTHPVRRQPEDRSSHLPLSSFLTKGIFCIHLQTKVSGNRVLIFLLTPSLSEQQRAREASWRKFQEESVPHHALWKAIPIPELQEREIPPSNSWLFQWLYWSQENCLSVPCHRGMKQPLSPPHSPEPQRQRAGQKGMQATSQKCPAVKETKSLPQLPGPRRGGTRLSE